MPLWGAPATAGCPAVGGANNGDEGAVAQGWQPTTSAKVCAATNGVYGGTEQRRGDLLVIDPWPSCETAMRSAQNVRGANDGETAEGRQGGSPLAVLPPERLNQEGRRSHRRPTQTADVADAYGYDRLDGRPGTASGWGQVAEARYVFQVD